MRYRQLYHTGKSLILSSAIDSKKKIGGSRLKGCYTGENSAYMNLLETIDP